MASSTRVWALMALIFLVMATVAFAEGGGKGSEKSSSTCMETFAVAGRKYKLKNRPLQEGEGVECPEGSPTSTVTFCTKPARVLIQGNFAAANLGVCKPAENPYTLPAGAVVTFEQYLDQVVLRILDTVPASFRVLKLGGKKVALGLSGQRYGVSTLIDVGAANC